MQPLLRRATRSLSQAAGLVSVLGLAPMGLHPMGLHPVTVALAGPGGAAGVRVVPVKGAAFEGTFSGCTADALSLEGKEALPLDGVREVRFAPDAPPPSFPEKAVGLRVVLRGDELLRGVLVGADADGLDVKPPDMPALRLRFDDVRRIETERPGRGACDEPARHRPPRAKTDVAYATSGDAFAGTLDHATLSGVTLDRDGDKRTVPWVELVVLHIDEPALPVPEGRTAEIDTVGGSRLTAASVEGDAKTLRVTTRAGLALLVPREAVATIRWWGGAFTYASRLPFTSERVPYYTDDVLDPSFLDPWYGARVDRTLWGCPLRIAGTPFRHGFAVHAKSILTIPLGGAYTSFESRFGIDDDRTLVPEDGPMGDVTARVLVDGKPVWTSAGSVRGGEAARVVGPLGVTGAKTLVLEVDFGEGQHQVDRADWGDPVLVRAPLVPAPK